MNKPDTERRRGLSRIEREAVVTGILTNLQLDLSTYITLKPEVKTPVTDGIYTIHMMAAEGRTVENMDRGAALKVENLLSLAWSLGGIERQFHGPQEWSESAITLLMQAATERNPEASSRLKGGVMNAAGMYVTALENVGRDLAATEAAKTPYMEFRQGRMDWFHAQKTHLQRALLTMPGGGISSLAK